MKNFGGIWTYEKLEILEKYIQAYLTIMKDRKYWKLMYFDGFAGSGVIETHDGKEHNLLEGMAAKVLKIDSPREYDMYYFVDSDEHNTEKLKIYIETNFPDKKDKCHIVTNDCNIKIAGLSNFLKKKENKDFKVLAFIDPCGMQLEWSSISILKGLPIDIWILLPKGIGVNRLLKNNGQISDSWLLKLKTSLGLKLDEIKKYFYKQSEIYTLFGKESMVSKEANAIDKAAELYREQLLKIFKFVSNPFPMKNKTGSTMFHFIMASNNKTAQNITNDIIRPYLK